MRVHILLLILVALAACTAQEMPTESQIEDTDVLQIQPIQQEQMMETMVNESPEDNESEILELEIDEQEATFAGGCFWCTEAAYEGLEGIIDSVSGYTGGLEETATYDQVSSGNTDHREAAQVTYDANKITYEELLEIYWRSIDPTDEGGQFADRGYQYTTAIYAHNQEQLEQAQMSKLEIEESGRFEEPIATEILEYENFYAAEEYHQNYAEKQAARYSRYKSASGREEFTQENWAGPKEEWMPKEEYDKSHLSTIQRHVTQNDGTEPPYANKYNNEKRDGIFVDIVSGEPLFSSKDKYNSGTGWPSFTKPIELVKHEGEVEGEEVEHVEGTNVYTKPDRGILGTRTEVRSVHADSHLGHVFEDGPEPTGLRYCMNSAAMRFIPKEEMEQEGYGAYLDQV